MLPVPLNLIDHPWLPFRRASGALFTGRPADMVLGLEEDPVVALAFPRPDFALAVTEWLIGITTAVMAPEDEDQWWDLNNTPPDVETLHTAYAPLVSAFWLDGDGPRCFQDHHFERPPTEGPVREILMDAPNDFFNKEEIISVLGRPAAAAALMTLQIFAPEGGRGHKVGLRGGGPLTTLVLPEVFWRERRISPLWDTVVANLPQGTTWRVPSEDRMAQAFPWLAPTRSSVQGRVTTPEDGHPLQMFFPLPRRIRLVFHPDPCVCTLTGEQDGVTVARYARLPNGTGYQGWRHPLSPHHRKKATDPWLPYHPQPGGLSYRDWLGVVSPGTHDTGAEAESVRLYTQRHGAVNRHPRLLAAGYDMKQMSARAWYQSEIPLHPFLQDQEALTRVRNRAAPRVQAAKAACDALVFAIKLARHGVRDSQRDEPGHWSYKLPKELKGDFSPISEQFWRETEADFADALVHLAGADQDTEETLRTQWWWTLRHQVLGQFDALVPLRDGAEAGARRVAYARYGLQSAINTRVTKALQLTRTPTRDKEVSP